MQIVHQRANHLLQISSHRVNLCLEINALLVNLLLFLMKTVAILIQNEFFSLFKCFYKKLSERLLYAIQLHVDLRDNHFKRTDRKHQQCLNVANDQALKLLCKRVPSNLYCLDIVKLRLCKRVFSKALLHIWAWNWSQKLL